MYGIIMMAYWLFVDLSHDHVYIYTIMVVWVVEFSREGYMFVCLFKGRIVPLPEESNPYMWHVWHNNDGLLTVRWSLMWSCVHTIMVIWVIEFSKLAIFWAKREVILFCELTCVTMWHVWHNNDGLLTVRWSLMWSSVYTIMVCRKSVKLSKIFLFNFVALFRSLDNPYYHNIQGVP